MCGGYSYRKSTTRYPGLYEPQYQSTSIFDRDHIRPGMAVCLYLANHSDGAVEAEHWNWGRQTRKHPKPIINARAETIDVLPTFATAFRERRCLVPADGWYEWVPEVEGPLSAAEAAERGLTRKGKKKLFYEFDGEPFCFAGIYGQGQVRTNEGWRPAHCVIIVTTDACPQIADSGHHRQPVIIPQHRFHDWLDPNFHHVGDVKAMLESQPYEGLSITHCANAS